MPNRQRPPHQLATVVPQHPAAWAHACWIQRGWHKPRLVVPQGFAGENLTAHACRTQPDSALPVQARPAMVWLARLVREYPIRAVPEKALPAMAMASLATATVWPEMDSARALPVMPGWGSAWPARATAIPAAGS